MDDREIIMECKQGNIESYGKLVKKYMKRAYNAALYYTKDPNDAWDVSQQAFLNAWNGIGKFDEDRPFFPWLYAIIKNESMKRFRNEKKTVERRDAPVIWKESPEDLIENRERIEKLKEAMDRLEEEKREIIYLRHFAEMSYREIAESLDIPEGTVMSRLYYARKSLLEEYKNG